MYYIDTPTRQVVAYQYDLLSGEIFRPRVAVKMDPADGWPDGMTSDSEGMLWVALWGGASLTCWEPAGGKLLEKISIPALNVSSCAFGGRDISDIYVTTAREGMTRRQLKEYPLSGGLFRIHTPFSGMPTYIFGG